MLYLPRNDHLLFAYFGISLQVRRRSEATRVRGRITVKRRLLKLFDRDDFNLHGGETVFIRDPYETKYPIASDIPDFDTAKPWDYFMLLGHLWPDHLVVVLHRYHAYISDTRKQWDAFEKCDLRLPGWEGQRLAKSEGNAELCDRAWRYFHNEIPENNRAWLEDLGLIHYDQIIAVDEMGDIFHPGPHLLVARDQNFGFFARLSTKLHLHMSRRNRGDEPEWLDPGRIKRTKYFPDEIPDVQWKGFKTPNQSS